MQEVQQQILLRLYEQFQNLQDKFKVFTLVQIILNVYNIKFMLTSLLINRTPCICTLLTVHVTVSAIFVFVFESYV